MLWGEILLTLEKRGPFMLERSRVSLISEKGFSFILWSELPYTLN